MIALADFSNGLSQRRLGEMKRLVEENKHEIKRAWEAFFGTASR